MHVGLFAHRFRILRPIKFSSHLSPLLRLRTIGPSCGCRLLFRNEQVAQKGHPTRRPQARKNRRRALWGTLRILSTRERRWGPFQRLLVVGLGVAGKLALLDFLFVAAKGLERICLEMGIGFDKLRHEIVE